MQRNCRFQISNFLLKALVKRVNLRSCILIVKFWRSTKLVEICQGRIAYADLDMTPRSLVGVLGRLDLAEIPNSFISWAYPHPFQKNQERHFCRK